MAKQTPIPNAISLTYNPHKKRESHEQKTCKKGKEFLNGLLKALDKVEREKFYRLCAYTRDKRESKELAIVWTNGFEIMEGKGTGIFATLSRINHSCVPNPPRPTIEFVEEEEEHELTESDRKEIEEGMRIVRFTEDVLAGTHPRVKIPEHLRLVDQWDFIAPLSIHRQKDEVYRDDMDGNVCERALLLL